MKRALFVLALIVITITFGIMELISVRKVLTQMEIKVNNLYNKYDDNRDNINALYDDLDDLKIYWEKQENWLCYLFNHRDLSTITDSINRLQAYTSNNDYDNSVSELSQLQEYSTKSHHIMGFNIHNIL